MNQTQQQFQWVREQVLAPVASHIRYWFTKPMAWEEKAIRLIYLSEFVFSIVTLGLVGGWISRTNAYIDGFRELYATFRPNDDISVGYPSDMYVTFVVAGLSLLVSFLLLLGKVRRFIGYTVLLHFIAGAMTTAWILAGIVISVRGDGGGGMLDDDQVVSRLNHYISLYQLHPENMPWDGNREIAASIGAVLRIFCFLNFGLWAGSVVLVEEVRRRDRLTNADIEKQLPPLPVETQISRRDAEMVGRVPPVRQPSIKLSTGTGVPYRPPSDILQEESEDEEPLQFDEINVPKESAVLTTAANPNLDTNAALYTGTSAAAGRQSVPLSAMYARARYDFIGRDANDLSFAKGDVIRVIRWSEDRNGWWFGERNGRVGEFPGTYVKMIRSTEG